jgi:hypothetical protein
MVRGVSGAACAARPARALRECGDACACACTRSLRTSGLRDVATAFLQRTVLALIFAIRVATVGVAIVHKLFRRVLVCYPPDSSLVTITRASTERSEL